MELAFEGGIRESGASVDVSYYITCKAVSSRRGSCCLTIPSTTTSVCLLLSACAERVENIREVYQLNSAERSKGARREEISHPVNSVLTRGG